MKGTTLRQFLSSLALLSRVPLRGLAAPDMGGVGLYLPVVGIVVGAVNAAVVLIARPLLRDSFLLAAGVLVVQYFLFNLFHFDGLVDSADALCAFADRPRKLAILRDVHVGSFALFFGPVYVGLTLYLLARLLDLSAPSPAALVLVLAYPVSGRISAALLGCSLKPARSEGLGASVGPFRAAHVAVGSACAVLAVVALAFALSPGGAARKVVLAAGFSGAALGFLVTAVPYQRQIGGFTGDGLGMAVELGELLHLLVLYLLRGTWT